MSSRNLFARFVPLPVQRLPDRGRTLAQPLRRRKHVAVMFVDIEGCTRRCEALPPAAMNRLLETYFSRYFEIVRETGGEVMEVLGDGLLALYEKPSIRQNVFGAVAASLKIRKATAELNARAAPRHDPVLVNIGLNAGIASVGITRLSSASAERWVYSASGPVTNVAARLCSLATRGQILTTKAVAEQLSETCECRSLGPRVLKNVSDPVHVFEVESLKIGGHQSNHGGAQRPRSLIRGKSAAGEPHARGVSVPTTRFASGVRRSGR